MRVERYPTAPRPAGFLLALGVMALSLILPCAATAGAENARDPGGNVIEGRYIVVYRGQTVEKAGSATAARERSLGFEASYVYRRGLEGFAAHLIRPQLEALRRDPAVDFVAEDRTVRASAEVPLAPGEPTPPTGVRRILAGSNTSVRETSGAAVAVIDTGIQLSHPDLNAVAGADCIDSGTPPDDGHGHGTHVAGTIGARSNGAGVTGVAPGTEVIAVRVLDDTGAGTMSSVICGIDWVTAHHTAENIGVANMSLGSEGPPLAGKTCATTTDPERAAICRSTAAGVTYVVAAGNSAWDFDYAPVPDVPAAYPEVLTVTALSDSDGKPGGLGGGPACRPDQSDDREASFSNFAATAAGEAHTIAAPGVCIRSTWPGGSYATLSGTSMASPHVAGEVALCLDEAGGAGVCKDKTPAQIAARMRSDAASYTAAQPGYGFLHDPAHLPLAGKYFGFLTRTPILRELTVSRAGGGTGKLSGPGIDCGTVCAESYEDGSSVTLTADPDANSSFGGWSGCDSPVGATCFMTLTADRSVAATFSPAPLLADTAPPQTTILSTRVTGASAKLVFASSEPGSSFQCRLDGAIFRPCGSPRRYRRLPPGRHRFQVRVVDAAGNTDPSPAQRRFSV